MESISLCNCESKLLIYTCEVHERRDNNFSDILQIKSTHVPNFYQREQRIDTIYDIVLRSQRLLPKLLASSSKIPSQNHRFKFRPASFKHGQKCVSRIQRTRKMHQDQNSTCTHSQARCTFSSMRVIVREARASLVFHFFRLNCERRKTRLRRFRQADYVLVAFCCISTCRHEVSTLSREL